MYAGRLRGGVRDDVKAGGMATPRGFEPPISTVTGWHVRPLHHGAVAKPTPVRVARNARKMRSGGSPF